jgi:hypothetical protein
VRVMSARHQDGIVPRVNALWWLHPVTAIVGISGVMALAAWLTPASTYREQWGVAKILGTDDVARIAACIAVLSIAAGITSINARHTVPWPAMSGTLQRTLATAFDVAVVLTAVGYLSWTGTALRNGVGPSLVLEVLRSGDLYGAGLRERIGTVAGLTTLTQIGIAVVIIGELLRAAGVHDHRSRFRRRAVIAVIAVSLVRSFLLSERLALLEVLIPLVAIRASAMAVHRPGTRSRLLLAPLLAVPLFALLFGLFEYQRSWSFYSERTDQTYPAFVLTRITGYYTTAYNNGQLPDRYLDNPNPFPYLTASFLRDFPLTADWAEAQVPDAAGARRGETLDLYANPEFNSPSSFGPAIFDFGFGGALVYFALTGIGIGLLYTGFAQGRTVGLLLYPVVVIGLADLPRQIYWTLGRTTPVVVFLALTAIVAGRRSALALQLARLRPTPTT